MAYEKAKSDLVEYARLWASDDPKDYMAKGNMKSSLMHLSFCIGQKYKLKYFKNMSATQIAAYYTLSR